MTMLRAAAETHPGYVRSTNQDLALVSSDLVAVADGMGGHLGGEVAARTAIEELLEAFRRDRSGDGLLAAARRANRAVWRQSRVDRTLHGMGTTLTVVALVAEGRLAAPPQGDGGVTVSDGEATETSAEADGQSHLVLLNVGDSRAYVLDGATGQFRQLTEDHSVVEEMVRHGELTHEEAAVHPHRHVLTRALGVEPEVAFDVWNLDAVPGSRFLLCSDGLTNELPDPEIADILARAETPEEAVGELVGRALGHGGMDNVTVVVADIVSGAGDPSGMSVQLIPPGAPVPEDPVAGTPELTEAIPLTAVPDDPMAGPPTAIAPATELFEGESHIGSLPGGALPGAPAAGSPGGPPGTAGGLLEGEGEVATGGGRPAVGEKAGGEAEPSGRSMTMRQRRPPPSIDGTIGIGVSARGSRVGAGSWSPAAGLDGGRPRPVVLVPKRRHKGHGDRVVTIRVATFVLLLVGLLAGTVAVVIWYEQSKYYVGLNGDAVAIYQGEPGGMLWFKPQLVETSAIRTNQLLVSSVVTLRSGLQESSLKAAEAVVARLRNEKHNAFEAETTTTLPATTLPPTTSTLPPTTVPPPTVTTTTKPKKTTTTTSSTTTTTSSTTTTTASTTTTSTSTTSTTAAA